MVRIDWDSRGQRYYTSGLDRVVLYLPDGEGIPWFGLYSIEETPQGGEIKPYYIDGYRYQNVASSSEYAATLHALQYPLEFDQCIGISYLANGLYATQQPPQQFGLAYRTLIGSDSAELGTWYKLHLIYRAMATPSTNTISTLHSEASMEVYSWEIQTLAHRIPGYAPIAHLVVDSRYADPGYLEDLEGHLYGTDTTDPIQLTPDQVTMVLEGKEVDFEVEEDADDDDD